MKFPDELYVQVEGEGENEFLNAQADPSSFAMPDGVEIATLYRKVGTVRIKSTLEIIMPRRKA